MRKYKFEIILVGLILSYAVYFSYFTILRHRRLGSAYYDLGIMSQTVYNTSKGRFLELTAPAGAENIKRMAIHNDVLLALLAPFYFIHQGPTTLLIIQGLILAFGALPLYLLAVKILKSKLAGLIIAFSYLLYPPLQRANIFDFHPVTLATSFLIFMVYLAYIKRYFLSFLFFLLAILSKENVALTTTMVGFYWLLTGKQFLIGWRQKKTNPEDLSRFCFGLVVSLFSIVWFVGSIWLIIPYFRGGSHFALSRYGQFGGSWMEVFKGIITKPKVLLKYLFNADSLRYLFFLFFPVGFLSFFSWGYLLLALPEFLKNLLSNSWPMKTVVFHYTSVITPFVFISLIFAVLKISTKIKFLTVTRTSFVLLIFSLLASFFIGPLPFSRQADLFPYKKIRPELEDVEVWKKILKDEDLIISASEHLAPHFTQRRIFYRFPNQYQRADYVLILKDDVFGDWLDRKQAVKKYYQLVKANQFVRIYKNKAFEVYKRVKK